MTHQMLEAVRRVSPFAFVLCGILVSSLTPGVAGATERRCGWLENPTPANFSLKDKEGEWAMGEQGGHQAIGMDEIPDLTTRGWVSTNGGYGYGCACITGRFDARTHDVVRIEKAEAVPLARCKADRALPSP